MPRGYRNDGTPLGASPERMRKLTKARTAGRKTTTRRGRRPDIVTFVKNHLGLEPSPAQETLLRSIYGLPLSSDQLEIFKACTGRSTYPGVPFRQVTAICGVQSGKSSIIASPVAAYEAIYGDLSKIKKGIRPVIPCVAMDARGSEIVFGSIAAYLAEPTTKKYVSGDPRGSWIELTNGQTVETFACTSSSLRGWAIPTAAVMDELAFFRLNGKINTDVEIQQSITRGMLHYEGAKLIKISSAYAKSGILYDDYKNHFGKDDDLDVLVWRASTKTMWPPTSEAALERERRLDPVRFAREYLGEFSEDFANFLAGAWIDDAIMRGVYEIPPEAGHRYTAGIDTSSGGPDAFTLSIVDETGQLTDRHVKQVLIKGWEKPRGSQMDLWGAVQEACSIVRRYGLDTVYGDRSTAQVYPQWFEKLGIRYHHPIVKDVRELHPLKDTKFTDAPERYLDKSLCYLEMETLFSTGHIQILDHPKMIHELRQLERSPRSGGHDRVDHPKSGHDDYANSLAVACAMARGLGLPRAAGGAARHQPQWAGGAAGGARARTLVDHVSRAY